MLWFISADLRKIHCEELSSTLFLISADAHVSGTWSFLIVGGPCFVFCFVWFSCNSSKLGVGHGCFPQLGLRLSVSTTEMELVAMGRWCLHYEEHFRAGATGASSLWVTSPGPGTLSSNGTQQSLVAVYRWCTKMPLVIPCCKRLVRPREVSIVVSYSIKWSLQPLCWGADLESQVTSGTASTAWAMWCCGTPS